MPTGSGPLVSTIRIDPSDTTLAEVRCVLAAGIAAKSTSRNNDRGTTKDDRPVRTRRGRSSGRSSGRSAKSYPIINNPCTGEGLHLILGADMKDTQKANLLAAGFDMTKPVEVSESETSEFLNKITQGESTFDLPDSLLTPVSV